MTRSNHISAGRTYVKPPVRSCLTCDASSNPVSGSGDARPFGTIASQEPGTPLIHENLNDSSHYPAAKPLIERNSAEHGSWPMLCGIPHSGGTAMLNGRSESRASRDFPNSLLPTTTVGLCDDCIADPSIRNRLFCWMTGQSGRSRAMMAGRPTLPVASVSPDCFVRRGSHRGTVSGRRSRRIRSRIARNSRFGTATSAIWKMTYRACVTTLAPILISFSGNVVSDRGKLSSG